MEENLNTNEQVQPKEVIPAETQQSSAPVNPGTSIPASSEVKEVTTTPVTQLQTTNQLQTDSMEFINTRIM